MERRLITLNTLREREENAKKAKNEILGKIKNGELKINSNYKSEELSKLDKEFIKENKQLFERKHN